MNTGHFEFVIPEPADESPSGILKPVWWKEGEQRRLLLHYQPSTPAQGGEVASDATLARRGVTWNKEQIEDFTRKLGFLEKGSEDGTHFQRLSAVSLHAVATALCALLSKLLLKRMCSTLMSYSLCRLLSECLQCSVS